MYERKRQLEWYHHLVHNHSILGSLVTLLHIPFMLAFLSMVALGTLTLKNVDGTVLLLSLAAVGFLLYGEHMLDDTNRVGKPWATVFSDRTLIIFAIVLFSMAGIVGVWASTIYGSPLPIIGIILGMAFCALYGLEFWKFHSIGFGALGMGAIPAFSYLVQSLTAGSPINPVIIFFLMVLGFSYGYVMLMLYEHTKTEGYKIAWKLLGMHFIMVYALAGAILYSKLL